MTDQDKDQGKDRDRGGNGGVDRGHEAEPRTADEQESPDPVRPRTIQEKKGQAARSQDDPPKAEGNRDEVDTRGRPG